MLKLSFHTGSPDFLHQHHTTRMTHGTARHDTQQSGGGTETNSGRAKKNEGGGNPKEEAEVEHKRTKRRWAERGEGGSSTK